MNLSSRKIPLLVLGATSIACSRAMFAFISDPEGPNLLVAIVLAAIVFLLSLAAYSFYPPATRNNLKSFLSLIVIQAAIVIGMYFLLH